MGSRRLLGPGVRAVVALMVLSTFAVGALILSPHADRADAQPTDSPPPSCDPEFPITCETTTTLKPPETTTQPITTTAPTPTTTSPFIIGTTAPTIPRPTPASPIPLRPSPVPSPGATPVLPGTPSPGETPSPTPSPSPSPSPSLPADTGTPGLTAVTPAGETSGPPGVALLVTIRDLPRDCITAYVFFAGTKIGLASVDGSGTARSSGLWVPGDASPGSYRVAGSCSKGGSPVEASRTFTVTDDQLHRSLVVTSVPDPSQIDLSLASLTTAAALTIGFLLLFAFPFQLFNSTLQENYEEVRGWFGLTRSWDSMVNMLSKPFVLPIFLAASGVIYAFLLPGFGFNQATLVVVVALALAVLVTTLGFGIPTFVYFLSRFKEKGRVLVLPGSVIVGLATVGISKLVGFQPGYVYGLLALFVFNRILSQKESGKLSAMSMSFALVISVGAWLLRMPVSTLTSRPNPGFWPLVAEAALTAIFLLGVESVMVALLPMRFLEGSKIRAWNQPVWIVLLCLAVYTFVLILLQPGSGYIGKTSTPAKVSVIALCVAFGIFSVSFWAYFRYRTPREGGPSQGREETQSPAR